MAKKNQVTEAQPQAQGQEDGGTEGGQKAERLEAQAQRMRRTEEVTMGRYDSSSLK